jgi:hypothetical protein
MTTTSLPTKSAIAIAAALILTGCAATDPVKVGRDTYMMANTGTWSWSSGAALKGELFQKADAFCQSKGLEVQPVSSASNNSAMGLDAPFAHADLLFRCLASSDPEVHRPTFKPTPNVRIEVER